MNSGTSLLLLLTLHLAGLVIMAGTTIVDYVVFRAFLKLPDAQRQVVLVTAKFSRLIGIGAALLILTGFGMMFLTNGAFGEQLWFRIKFALVLILIANALIVGRRQGSKFRGLMTDHPSAQSPHFPALVKTLNRFYLAQLTIFAAIVFLSVFKFN